MTEEEKEAIETINLFLNKPVRFKNKNIIANNEIVAIKTLLNLIEKLQKENLLLSAKENMSAYFEFKRNYILKDKIREIINEELPDDEICKVCERYDVNGVVIKQKLIKVLEED